MACRVAIELMPHDMWLAFAGTARDIGELAACCAATKGARDEWLSNTIAAFSRDPMKRLKHLPMDLWEMHTQVGIRDSISLRPRMVHAFIRRTDRFRSIVSSRKCMRRVWLQIYGVWNFNFRQSRQTCRTAVACGRWGHACFYNYVVDLQLWNKNEILQFRG